MAALIVAEADADGKRVAYTQGGTLLVGDDILLVPEHIIAVAGQEAESWESGSGKTHTNPERTEVSLAGGDAFYIYNVSSAAFIRALAALDLI